MPDNIPEKLNDSLVFKSYAKNNEKVICQKVTYILKENIRKDISLCNLLENKLNYKYGTLRKVFKKATGKTIISFHDELILNKVEFLLKETDLNVAEIGYEAGFNYDSYFVKWYYKKTGIYPKQSRKV